MSCRSTVPPWTERRDDIPVLATLKPSSDRLHTNTSKRLPLREVHTGDANEDFIARNNMVWPCERTPTQKLVERVPSSNRTDFGPIEKARELPRAKKKDQQDDEGQAVVCGALATLATAALTAREGFERRIICSPSNPQRSERNISRTRQFS